MTPQAQAMTQVLLDHHGYVCRPFQHVDPAPINACTITYGDLCQRAGVPELTRYPGRFLQEIAEWCHEHDPPWPPLNSLAVNAETGMPGEQYEVAPGCSLLNWPTEVTACIRFDYPEAI